MSSHSFLAALESDAAMNAAATASDIHAFSAMPAFANLPVELLPELLRPLRYRQNDLARTSLVCKSWANASRPVRSLAVTWITGRKLIVKLVSHTMPNVSPQIHLQITAAMGVGEVERLGKDGTSIPRLVE